MHAFLLVGNNTEKEIADRMKDWSVSPWDVVRVSGAGISDIRDFRRELSIAPQGRSKVGIIEHIELLTPEAQNALLKTIEEPPPHTYIIGTTSVPETLLPTIVSRMSVVRLTDSEHVSDTTLLRALLAQTPGTLLSAVEPYGATRDDAKKFISSLLFAARQELLAHPSSPMAALVRNLLTAQSQLSVNVNQKLVVDNCFLHLPKTAATPEEAVFFQDA